MQIKGVIASGAGKGAYFAQVEWVVQQCAEKLGFIPFPGTLNVTVPDQDFPAVQRLLAAAEISLVPTDPAFCTARVQPVTVRGIPAALVLPSEEVRIHGNATLELLSPCHLKRTFGLRDGDPVVVSTPDENPQEGTVPLYREIYEFAASAGALEGYVYLKEALEASHLDKWVRNLVAQYRGLPGAAREAVQPGLDRTLGRAAHSIAAVLGDSHPHAAALRSIVVGDMPASATDFEEDKASKAEKYGA
jgi:hypothetical protein